jgi:hypothetical protein
MSRTLDLCPACFLCDAPLTDDDETEFGALCPECFRREAQDEIEEN